MACSKWEETGLLYTSQELDPKTADEFREHLSACEECRNEYEQYQGEHKTFFTPEILGESPSESVDAEIKRVCGSARKRVTSAGLFPLIFRRTVYSVSFFLVGFVVVGYFAVHMERAGLQAPNARIDNAGDSALAGATVSRAAVAAIPSKDTVGADSAGITDAPYTRTRGNLDVKGVYPVDLQQK